MGLCTRCLETSDSGVADKAPAFEEEEETSFGGGRDEEW